MQDGFIRVAAGTPQIALANPKANEQEIIRLMRDAAKQHVQLFVLPELCLTGATCGDLFWQRNLQQAALDALKEMIIASAKLDMLVVVGLPLKVKGKLYNCAAVFKSGELLGIVPKTHLDANQRRWFADGSDVDDIINILDMDTLFGQNLQFTCCEQMSMFTMKVELSGQPWASSAANGTVIACLSAQPEIVGAPEQMRQYVLSRSKQCAAGFVLAAAGMGESSTDYVFAGRSMIAEDGHMLAAAQPYEVGLIMTELDLGYLEGEQKRVQPEKQDDVLPIEFSMQIKSLKLARRFEAKPFVPANEQTRAERCEQILNIQAQGLARRMRHIGCKTAVLGVSGGLDSTLAMLVTARALKLLDLEMSSLLPVTMPCYGTTDRTKSNAYKLTEALGGELKEINISAAVTQHLQDIGHALDVHDAAYENAQARERTQVLMDMANMCNGLVVGTGDLSELALGWATYNGDHMSMYGVNAGVPKTLVRHLVRHAADQDAGGTLGKVLMDILDTPVSPELLPPTNGTISQKTEELVGPYELHDFFLYHFLRRKAEPEKILRLAQDSFEGQYDAATIEKWLKVFLKRFFSQQFKRSCSADAPAIGSVGLSPRGGLCMPSDAISQMWL